MSNTPDSVLAEAFNLYDKEGKGWISGDLLGVVLRSVGKIPSQKEIETFKKEALKRGGKITLKQLSEIAGKINRTVSDDQIKAAYQVFDRDGKGFILVKEFRHILSTVGEKLSEKDVNTMLQQANIGKDGKISFAQFEKIMKGGF